MNRHDTSSNIPKSVFLSHIFARSSFFGRLYFIKVVFFKDDRALTTSLTRLCFARNLLIVVRDLNLGFTPQSIVGVALINALWLLVRAIGRVLGVLAPRNIILEEANLSAAVVVDATIVVIHETLTDAALGDRDDF